MAKRRPLPPFGKQYLNLHPDSGVRVAIGFGAWDFANAARPGRVMVLPAGTSPTTFRWPVNGQPALVHELGPVDDDQLAAMARALLAAGAPSVVALRHSLLATSDCRVFFEAADHVA